MVAWYSNHNVYRGNIGKRSRYSIHFMFANNNVWSRATFYDNAVGVYPCTRTNPVLRNNVVSHATGAAGMALGFRNRAIPSSRQRVIYCAVGIGSDSPRSSPTPPSGSNNRFAFNGIAVQFTANWAATSSPTTSSKAT